MIFFQAANLSKLKFKSCPKSNLLHYMCFAFPPSFCSSFSRPLLSMLGINMPFKKEDNVLWVMIWADHTVGPQQLRKTKTTQMWWVSMCVCMWTGWRAGVFCSPVSWMRSHPCLRGKKASAVGSPGQWTSVRCSCPQSHRQGLPPMILNYTIVPSLSTLPRLVRHHLLSPQKAL